MRHIVLLIPLLVAAAPPALARPIDDSRARCPKPATTPGKATFKRLGDLPPAEAFHAVLRSSDCPAPVIQARDRLGTFPKPRR